MDKLKMHSPDLSQDNIAKLRELFPGCVTEAHDEATGKLRPAVDFDQLRQELRNKFFVNTIAVNMKNVAGASGGGEDKRLKKNIEYLHVFVRSRVDFSGFNHTYDLFPISGMVQEYRDKGKSWKYTNVLVDPGKKLEIGSTVDGEGNKIKIFERSGFVISSISQIQRDEGISEEEAYNKYATRIFQTTMPQSSIRPRVMNYVLDNGGICSDLYSIEYVPRSGRNKGKPYEQFYKGEHFRLFAWLRDVSEEKDGVFYK